MRSRGVALGASMWEI